MGWLTADTVPVIVTAIGVSVSLVWALVGKNKDAARDALMKQIDMMQRLLEKKDNEREQIRAKRMELEQANALLEVRIAKLEAERGRD